MIKELYRFSEEKKAPLFTTNQKFYFCLDVSNSMGAIVDGTTTRLDVAVADIKKAISAINDKRIAAGVQVDIGIAAWSDTYTEIIVDNVTSLTALNNWLDALVPLPYTNYEQALIAANSYFLRPKVGSFRQSMYFITDGTPSNEAAAITAATTYADLIGRSGAFSSANDNVVDIYACAIDLFDTTFTALYDNTPDDGVAVSNSALTDSIYSLIMNTVDIVYTVTTVTSADSDEVFAGEIYKSMTLGRDDLVVQKELAKSKIEIKVSIDSTLGQMWLGAFIENPVKLIIYEKEAAEVKTIWTGRLASVSPKGHKINIIFDTGATAMRRSGVRGRVQRTCGHAHYGRGCRLDKSNFAIAGTVTAEAENVITVTEAGVHPVGHFAGGMAEDLDGNLRFISSHDGENLTLVRPFVGLGVSVTIYPGCDRSKERCDDEFNNLPNYEGKPFLPGRNPFAGTSLI